VTTLLLDTGPVVALLSQKDKHHAWALDTFGRLSGILISCEAVLSEVCFLFQASPAAVDSIWGRIEQGMLRLESLVQETANLRKLMWKYRDQPMSYADACLVRLSERYPRSALLTTDRDFVVYRRNGRQKIPLIAPFA
jgi:predicted nucleic acid-binding protein